MQSSSFFTQTIYALSSSSESLEQELRRRSIQQADEHREEPSCSPAETERASEHTGSTVSLSPGSLQAVCFQGSQKCFSLSQAELVHRDESHERVTSSCLSSSHFSLCSSFTSCLSFLLLFLFFFISLRFLFF